MKMNKKMLIRIMVSLLCVLYILSTITFCNGAFVKNNFTGTIDSGATKAGDAIVKIISSILGVTRTIGATVALVIFMWIAVKYILASAGEKADLKKYLTTYVIGGLILFGASGIMSIIKTVLDSSLE